MARNLNQVITRWIGTRSFEGMTFSTPEQIKGRWEDKIEQFIGNTGKEEISKSIIALDTTVNIGDYLFKGTSAEADPRTLSNASEVRSYKEMENLRNVGIERIAIL